MLIDKGADTELQDKARGTPLNRASLYNSIDVAKVESL